MLFLDKILHVIVLWIKKRNPKQPNRVSRGVPGKNPAQGLNITLLASGDEKQPAATDFEVAQFRGKAADFKTEWR